MKIITTMFVAFAFFSIMTSNNCGKDSENLAGGNSSITDHTISPSPNLPSRQKEVFLDGQPSYPQLDSNQVSAAQARWKSVKLRKYSYTFSYLPLYGLGFRPQSFRVVGSWDAVESVVPIGHSDTTLIRDLPGFGTVEGMLDVALAELRQEAIVFGEFDEEFGYPKEIQIKRISTRGSPSAVYYSFKISDFKEN